MQVYDNYDNYQNHSEWSFLFAHHSKQTKKNLQKTNIKVGKFRIGWFIGWLGAAPERLKNDAEKFNIHYWTSLVKPWHSIINYLSKAREES